MSDDLPGPVVHALTTVDSHKATFEFYNFCGTGAVPQPLIAVLAATFSYYVGKKIQENYLRIEIFINVLHLLGKLAAQSFSYFLKSEQN